MTNVALNKEAVLFNYWSLPLKMTVGSIGAWQESNHVDSVHHLAVVVLPWIKQGLRCDKLPLLFERGDRSRDKLVPVSGKFGKLAGI